MGLERCPKGTYHLQDRILLGPTKFRGVPDKGKAKVSNDSLTTPPRGLWSPGSTPSPLKEINDFFGNAPSESIMGGISMPSPFRFGYADPSQAESQDQVGVYIVFNSTDLLYSSRPTSNLVVRREKRRREKVKHGLRLVLLQS